MIGEGIGLGERQGPAVRRPGVLQSLDAPTEAVYPLSASWAPSRDFAVAGADHPIQRIRVAPDVLHVKTGTPVKPGLLGWEIALPHEAPVAFAGNHHTAGESFVAYRAMTLETYVKRFSPGASYAITEIDDLGNIRLELDPGGPYLALSESQLLLDAGRWRQAPIGVIMPAPPVIKEEVKHSETPRLDKLKTMHSDDDVYALPDRG